MRVVYVTRLVDRIKAALHEAARSDQQVSHIEMTLLELQQVTRELNDDRAPWQSDGPHETRLFGHRVVVI